jgi:two-component system sensor histidine kinase RegB
MTIPNVPSMTKIPFVSAAPPDLPQASDTANRKNMMLLIQLRWIAVVGQIVTIALVRLALGIPLPLVLMSLVLAGLVLLNAAGSVLLRTRTMVSNRAILMALVIDVVALTAQLWLSGGATNPFVSLYLLQVTLAAVLLDAQSTWLVVALACINFAGLAVFAEPLMLPDRYRGEMFTLHIAGMLVCFVLDAALLVFFVARVTGNLRERDANLAAMRQREAEEDHIVRMGLLATGAAHELGTPLASLAVILGDWRRMPAITTNADLFQEVEEMQTAVLRCKTIVTGILLAAGEARGEGPAVTSVKTFLNEITDEWRAARPTAMLRYENRFGVDLPIVSDPALKQVLFNVLDNAFEASPHWIGFFAYREADALVLEISDAGAGFAPEMLAQFGKPYQSSKGKLGGGLGLFLVVNVVRKFGGLVQARNLDGRGATVALRLPLDALTIGAHGHVG